MILDAKTLFFLFAFVHILQALGLIYVRKIHQNYPPALFWAAGSTFLAIGLVSTAFRPMMNEVFSIVITQFSINAGVALLNGGIILACDKRPPWRLARVIFAAMLCLIVWFTLVTPDISVRTWAMTLWVVCCSLYSIITIVKYPKCELKQTLLFLASLQCIETCTMLTRTILLGIIGRENSLHSNPIETVFNLIMIASTFLTAFLLSTFTSQRLQRELRHAARHDELTGLYNRRAFAELADREWLRGSRHIEAASMLMMDLDFFKTLNDRYGHQVGDIVLVETAKAIQQEIRGEDICCRFGGEEFVAYLVDTNASQAMALAERLRAAIEDLHIPAIAGFSLSISIGISARSADHQQWEDMITSADIALYQAKHEGRNRVCVYRPQNNTLVPA